MRACDNFGTADWNIQCLSQFSEPIEVYIKERFFEPSIAKPLQFATCLERRLVTIHDHWVCHQREIISDSFPHGAVAGDIKIEPSRRMKLVPLISLCLYLQRFSNIIFRTR